MTLRKPLKNDCALVVDELPNGKPLYYSPLPHQLIIHSSKAYLRGLLGGYGSGKSLTGVCENIVLGTQYKRCQLMHISPTLEQAKLSTIPLYEKIIDLSGLANKIKFNKQDFRFDFNNGSQLWIKSGLDPSRLKGGNLMHVTIDEPFLMSREVYEQAVARIRTGSRRGVLLTGTPENGISSWGYELLYQPRAETPEDLERLLDRCVITVPTRENPYNGEEYEQHIKATYDPELAEAYLEGKFINISTLLAYHSFDEARNVFPTVYNPDLPLYWSIDFNVSPFCSGVFQYDPVKDIDFCIDEIILSRGTCEKLVQSFANRYRNHKASVYITGDPTGRNSSTHSDLDWSNFDIIINKMKEFLPGVKIIDRRPAENFLQEPTINFINGRLHHGKLIIDPKCKTLIKDFRFVLRQKNENKIDKTCEKDGLSHCGDFCRYYCWEFRRGPKISGFSSKLFFR